MKKILISGGNGEFAKQILKYNKRFKIFAPTKKEMDITKLESIIQFIKKKKKKIFHTCSCINKAYVST